jgi:GntR family transcriptional repressor for pyruvate dehydrogenase complex
MASKNAVRTEPTPNPGGGVNGVAGRPSMSMGSVRRHDRRRAPKTSERVALDIVHDIVAQGLATGARLPLEVEMVEQYGVSRTSLREALRLLEVQGLIRLKPGPGGGPVVGAVEPTHLARTLSLYFHLASASYGQLLKTQVRLEPICAEIAAQSPARKDVMRPYTRVAQPETTPEYHRHTIDFHAAVYSLVDDPVLTLLTQAVTQMVTYHVVATMDPVDLHGGIMEEHAALARAIAAGHSAKARRLMAEHFQAQHDYYATRSPSRLADLIEWR